MEITTNPETYTPYIDLETQAYSDHNIINIKYGMVCPCTPTKVFYKREQFSSHKKTKKHRLWIDHLNANANNFYVQCLEHDKTIKTQQMLLAQADIKSKQDETIIKYLEQKMVTLESELLQRKKADILSSNNHELLLYFD